MKNFLVLFGLFAFGHATPVTLYREKLPGLWVKEILTEPLTNYSISTDDVKIFFRNRQNGGYPVEVDMNDPEAVIGHGFSKDKDTVFIVHGWQNQFDSDVNSIISDAVLEANDANVFIVDWSRIAMGLYTVAQAAVPGVGKIVGDLIIKLVHNAKLDLNRTSITGHSLGAHIAGLAGAAVDGRVNHIVGLDPALPLFNRDDTSKRLDTSDAQFVVIIHTCAGLLGFDTDIGHVDYWPNGGSNQPGCNFDVTGSCSHSRAYLYYGESLRTSGFISHKCDNYDNYNRGHCDNGIISPMGEYIPDYQAYGSYYLHTNKKSPFAQN